MAMAALRPPPPRRRPVATSSPPHLLPCLIRASLAPTIRTRLLGRRRPENHLRQKLLKTLAPIPADCRPVEEFPHRQAPTVISEELVPVEEVDGEEKELVLHFEGSEARTTDNVEGLPVRSNAGLFWGFVGLFLAQTAVSVWIVGFHGRNAKFAESESDAGAGRSEVVQFSGRVGVGDDGSEMEDRILSIRRMAREARANEKMKLENERVDADGGDVPEQSSSFVGVIADVEEGIERRLSRKNHAFHVPKHRIPSNLIPNLSTSGTGVGAKKLRKCSKGDGRSQESNTTSDSATKLTARNGALVKKDTVSPRLDIKSSRVQAQKNVEVLENNGEGSRLKDEQRLKLEKKSKGRYTGMEKSLWWQELPYVFVILLQNKTDNEGARGFFSLKRNRNGKGSISHMVAFEDRVDGNNLCHILESFFEDLGDVTAAILPLSVKELESDLISSSKKVIVVRKGQLKLYAGQPLTDVEEALYSLVD